MSHPQLEFVTVDVFTKTKYIGNPLAIIHVPAGTELEQEQKQLIAREFNLSESVFLHLPATTDDIGDGVTGKRNFRKIDIFTTDTELPFAGHPTIGTACYVLSSAPRGDADADGIVHGEFITKAGRIALQYNTATEVARATIPHDVRTHRARYSLEKLQEVQPALGPQSFLRNDEKDFPVVSIVNGMTFVLVQMKDLEAFKPPTLIPLAARTPVDLDDGWTRPEAWIYTYVALPDSPDGTRNIRSRMMAEGGEDPATGSAACALSCYLASQADKRGETMKFQITQGVEMGRKSDVGVEVMLTADGNIKSVFLSGSAVRVMEGKVSY